MTWKVPETIWTSRWLAHDQSARVANKDDLWQTQELELIEDIRQDNEKVNKRLVVCCDVRVEIWRPEAIWKALFRAASESNLRHSTRTKMSRSSWVDVELGQRPLWGRLATSPESRYFCQSRWIPLCLTPYWHATSRYVCPSRSRPTGLPPTFVF